MLGSMTFSGYKVVMVVLPSVGFVPNKWFSNLSPCFCLPEPLLDSLTSRLQKIAGVNFFDHRLLVFSTSLFSILSNCSLFNRQTARLKTFSV